MYQHFSLHSTLDDRDLSRAAAERVLLLQEATDRQAASGTRLGAAPARRSLAVLLTHLQRRPQRAWSDAT